MAGLFLRRFRSARSRSAAPALRGRNRPAGPVARRRRLVLRRGHAATLDGCRAVFLSVVGLLALVRLVLFGHLAGGGAGGLGLATDGVVVSVETAGDVPLLGDADDGLRGVVHDEACGQEHLEHRKGDRQVLHDLGLRGRHGRRHRARGDHALLHEVQTGQRDDEKRVGDALHEILAHDRGGTRGEVEAERQHLVALVERCEQLGVLRDVTRVERAVCAQAGEAVENAEHDDEHRHLSEQRQTRRQRVDLVLLVELHHLFVQLLPIVAMRLLQTTHLGLQALHLEHALGALQGERREDEHDRDGDQRDGACVAVHEAVELADEPGCCLEHGSYLLEMTSWGSGTGSKPDGPKGRQRASRRSVSQKPWAVPCVSNASWA